jgi:hypothetical protein
MIEGVVGNELLPTNVRQDIMSSLSTFVCTVSSCTNPAARSIWPVIG